MDQSLGVFFALLTTLSWSICIFPFTQAARRLGSNSLNHFRLLLAILFILFANLVFGAHDFSRIFSVDHSYAWIWLGLSGIVGLTFGDFFAFRMYSILGPRIGSVLTTLSPAAALLFGYILLEEKINATGMAGIAITMTGVMAVSLGRKERGSIPDHGHGSIARGIIFGLFFSILQGVGLVLSKKGMMQGEFTVDPMPATFIRMTIAFSSLFIFTLVTGRLKEVAAPVLKNQNKGVKYALTGAVFGPFLAVCLSLFAIQNLDVSVAQTIFSLVPACTLLISIVFFKEKVSTEAIIGVVAALIGVIILIWRGPIQLFLF